MGWKERGREEPLSEKKSDRGRRREGTPSPPQKKPQHVEKTEMRNKLWGRFPQGRCLKKGIVQDNSKYVLPDVSVQKMHRHLSAICGALFSSPPLSPPPPISLPLPSFGPKASETFFIPILEREGGENFPLAIFLRGGKEREGD